MRATNNRSAPCQTRFCGQILHVAFMSNLKRVPIVIVLAARVLLFAAILINGPVPARAQTPAPNQKPFPARGVVRELKPDGKTVVIQHEDVTNYMPAMTMPFDVKDPDELKGLQPGDAVDRKSTRL